MPAVLAFACLPAAMAAVTSPDPDLALAFTGLWMVTGISWFGACYAACQSLVPPRMRATLSAILLLLTTLLGFGLGPLITGAISDATAPFAAFAPSPMAWSARTCSRCGAEFIFCSPRGGSGGTSQPWRDTNLRGKVEPESRGRMEQ